MSKQSERLFKAISNLNDEMIDPALEPRKRRKTRRWMGWARPWLPASVWWQGSSPDASP